MSENKPRKKKPRILRIVLLIIILLYLAVFAAGGVFFSKMMKGIPELRIRDFVSQETTKIYDCNGDLIQEVGAYFRDNVTYDSFPESLIDAFLSVEDSRFFTHNGFDIPRFTKVVWEAVKTKSLGAGGSTFTMQLVKNTYFSIENGDESVERTKSISYKVQQIWLSMKLERLMGKKEILTLYLNNLNFGKNIRGVKRASMYYFGKDCTELNIGESALLAGIVNMPNYYNPYEYLEHAVIRRNQVLDMMALHGYISEEECKLAKAVNIEDQLEGEYSFIDDEQVHQTYVDVVLQEAERLTGKDPMLTGMDIYTAMNPNMQDLTEAIQDGSGGILYPNDLMQSAIVVMNNRNGEVAAIGGGRNYEGVRLLNRASDMYQQPGSAVKPVLSYALGFEYLGYSMDELLLDKPITLPTETRVLVNFSRTYRGDISIKDAVAASLNIPAVLTFEDAVSKMGEKGVIDYMHSIGFSRIPDSGLDFLYAIGGNRFTTSPMEMAGAHGAMINRGIYNKPHTITMIRTSLGEVYEPEGLNQQVLSSGSAYLVCKLMQNNVEGYIFNYMQLLARDYPVYAKTGTTDYGSDGLQYGIPQGAAKDKWMIASTAEYTNAVWVGWDKAEKNKDTYFTNEYSSMNIPGRINQILLDEEEKFSDGAMKKGVKKPDDVEEVKYIYGTYPHVLYEDGLNGSRVVASPVSSAGLKNTPSVTKADYQSGKVSLKGILASVTGSEIAIQWNTITPPCSGSRNISLHDEKNDINAYGACLAAYGWLSPDMNFKYKADIYQDGKKIDSVEGTNGFYKGKLKDASGEIKVCGTVTAGGTTSQEACFIAIRKE